MKTDRNRGRKPLCTSRGIIYSTDGNFIYAEKDGAEVRLDLFSGRYYKLKPYNGVPVLEIDGLRMQLVKDFRTPLDYPAEVVKGLMRPSEKGTSAGTHNLSVLDTCMGLGYTAIAAARIPAVRAVVTCEVSPAVVTLAKWNPFSDLLWEKNGKITVIEGSIAELIGQFDDGMFAFVIHDPPRITHAPELYSPAFYAELYRVCRKRGRIFHYVGSVGKGKGRRIDREVTERLLAAGFSNVSYSARLQGIFASK